MGTRVQLGKLPSGGYGLLVTGPDGVTVIIDSTSNMFKIAATGTLSGTKATGSDGLVEGTTLFAMGILNYVPAHIAYMSNGSAVTNLRVLGPGLGRTLLYAASSSGGSPTTPFLGVLVYSRIQLDLTADPGYAKVELWIDNHSGANQTRWARWYVFLETGN